MISLFLLATLPMMSFPAEGIPVQASPGGNVVYVQYRAIPSGSWEQVALDGVLAGASGDHLLVKTSEGFQHYVCITGHTRIQGQLVYGAPINVRAHLIHGTLFASAIQISGQAPAYNQAYNNYSVNQIASAPPANPYPYPSYPYAYPYPYTYPYTYYPYGYPSAVFGFGIGWGGRGWGWGGGRHGR